MAEEELLTKFILGTVTNVDCQRYTHSFNILCGFIRDSRNILESFGFKVSSAGTMLGPKDHWTFMYNIDTIRPSGYKLTIIERKYT